MNAITITLCCLILLVLQQEIDAVNCYTCIMGTDGCGPSFNAQGSGVVATTSNTSATYCTKNVVTSNINAITRSYGTTGSCIEGSSLTSGITIYQYCCSTDLCNKGAMGTANFLVGLIFVLTVYFF